MSVPEKTLQIHIVDVDGKVVMTFGQAINCLVLTPEQASEIATSLSHCADTLMDLRREKKG